MTFVYALLFITKHAQYLCTGKLNQILVMIVKVFRGNYGNDRQISLSTPRVFKMSMLAEKRVREKWCQDPRNTQWSNG